MVPFSPQRLDQALGNHGARTVIAFMQIVGMRGRLAGALSVDGEQKGDGIEGTGTGKTRDCWSEGLEIEKAHWLRDPAKRAGYVAVQHRFVFLHRSSDYILKPSERILVCNVPYLRDFGGFKLIAAT